jgi:hypothetical protein
MNAGTVLKEAKKMLCPHCYMKIKTFEKNDWVKGKQNVSLFLCNLENKRKLHFSLSFSKENVYGSE